MGVELREADLTNLLVEGNHSGRDGAADVEIILDDHRTAFRRRVEVVDWEQSWETDSDVDKNAEYVPSDYFTRDANS